MHEKKINKYKIPSQSINGDYSLLNASLNSFRNYAGKLQFLFSIGNSSQRAQHTFSNNTRNAGVYLFNSLCVARGFFFFHFEFKLFKVNTDSQCNCK